MDQGEVERILPGWQEARQAVAREMAEWRRAHPRATLAQIEDAVFEAVPKLQARALGQVVHASAVADVAAHPTAERPPARRVVATWSRATASGEGFGPRVNVGLWTFTGVTRCVPAAEPVFSPWMKNWSCCQVS